MYEPDDLIPESDVVKRMTRKDGIGSGNAYKDQGVKKVLIIGAVQKVKESTTNCKLLMDLTKINDIKYIMTGD